MERALTTIIPLVQFLTQLRHVDISECCQMFLFFFDIKSLVMRIFTALSILVKSMSWLRNFTFLCSTRPIAFTLFSDCYKTAIGFLVGCFSGSTCIYLYLIQWLNSKLSSYTFISWHGFLVQNSSICWFALFPLLYNLISYKALLSWHIFRIKLIRSIINHIDQRVSFRRSLLMSIIYSIL